MASARRLTPTLATTRSSTPTQLDWIFPPVTGTQRRAPGWMLKTWFPLRRQAPPQRPARLGWGRGLRWRSVMPSVQSRRRETWSVLGIAGSASKPVWTRRSRVDSCRSEGKPGEIARQTPSSVRTAACRLRRDGRLPVDSKNSSTRSAVQQVDDEFIVGLRELEFSTVEPLVRALALIHANRVDQAATSERLAILRSSLLFWDRLPDLAAALAVEPAISTTTSDRLTAPADETGSGRG